ncbi:oligopeptide ABC transporter substrate-binding protein OppA [Saccharobesus litoralis]|uniref:Oligopeptide ABC transporter substrate-binding protein OppA n=1 Tax=Saccharobesus litoralis TaxID=2172099 RepID=A0A2S0VXC5_9ALTE|nr:ABC transporter substrate-binding protein [Saccharobesus litoralis]AWB66346.1 oligopeptide ABC transporter substrate-binding protein OppA [Saccharobesus litoralis]AWB68848.1 oligopeptide ABC transporter substrate-binding protein OppA [Saccharobesus litoralis]
MFAQYPRWFKRCVLLSVLSLTCVTSLQAANVPQGVKLAAKQELVRGIGSEVPSLDPHKSEAMNASAVIRDLIEGLTSEDENGQLIPAVASHWQTDDNRTFIFHLRKDAVWSNGDPVTADDFVYSWRRLADPNTASPYGWYLEMTTLKNAAEVLKGDKKPETLGITALDKHTLKFELNESLPYFPKMLVHTSVKPVHQATLEKFGDKWTRPGNYVGNGAFLLKEWIVNERMVLVKNPKYMDADKVILDKVVYLPIENQVAEMNRFLSGEIDITYELPNEHYTRLARDFKESVTITPMLCSYYYGVRVDNPPFDDVRIRKALSYALDRDIIAQYIVRKGVDPAYYFTPDKTAGMAADLPEYATWSQEKRNQEAKRLLKEAGYDKNNPLKFELLYNTSENHKKIATAVRQLWKQTLGVHVSLINEEWKTFLDTRRFGVYQLTRSGWCGDYNEPSTFLTLLMSNNSSNDMRYKSQRYDDVVNRALQSTTEQERSLAYKEAEAILAEDMPIIPLYHYVNARLVKPRVGGYPMNNALDIAPSKSMYIKQM